MTLGLARLPLLGVVCVLALAGCSDSGDARNYRAETVEGSLRTHGFEVEVIFDRSKGDVPEATVLGLLALYSDFDDVEALVADTSPDGAIGGEASAWVFDTAAHADAFQAGRRFRLQRQNVVVFTDEQHKAAASAALRDLG
jgi:hypothetical protein